MLMALKDIHQFCIWPCDLALTFLPKSLRTPSSLQYSLNQFYWLSASLINELINLWHLFILCLCESQVLKFKKKLYFVIPERQKHKPSPESNPGQEHPEDGFTQLCHLGECPTVISLLKHVEDRQIPVRAFPALPFYHPIMG